MMHRTAWSLAALLLVGITGCKRDASPPVAAPSPSPAPVAKAAPQPVSIDPCALLPADAIARLAPANATGERDSAEETYGTYTCRWGTGADAVVMQVFSAGPGGLPHELRAASLEIVDFKREDAGTLVRIERFPGIGDAAGAFVERADAKRGIRRSYAALMVQRGDRLAALRVPGLAAGERDAALGTLKSLAGEIAKRL